MDLKCPLEEGEKHVVKVVGIPGLVPNGKYNVVAEAYTEKGHEEITCLVGEVEF